MSSKSPVMAKSFAIPNNANAAAVGGYNNSVKGSGKPQSIGYAKRVTDFDNPLTSNTVDLTTQANSQKDNQMLYKMMFQGGTGR